MERRRFFLISLAGMPAAAGAARAQHTRRIAYISATSLSPAHVKDLEDALQERGWVPGRSIVVEYRSANGQYGRLPALVEDVLRMNPELILSSQTPTTQAIRKVTTTIPIVMVGHGDPVRYGLVTNLARPRTTSRASPFSRTRSGS